MFDSFSDRYSVQAEYTVQTVVKYWLLNLLTLKISFHWYHGDVFIYVLAHVFFDDAFIEKEDAEDAEEHPKINHYVETFIKMVKKAAE